MKAIKQKNMSCASDMSQGFTLLEVLIAMVIFSTTVVFLLKSISDQEFAHTNISLKTVAHWVAVNKINETRSQKNWPSIGTTRGEQEMRNHTWYWSQIVSGTSEKELRQVEIEVRYQESDKFPTTRFVGFMANKNIRDGQP